MPASRPFRRFGELPIANDAAGCNVCAVSVHSADSRTVEPSKPSRALRGYANTERVIYAIVLGTKSLSGGSFGGFQ